MSPTATRIGGESFPLEPRYPIDGVVYRSAAEARAQFDQSNWLNVTFADTLRAAEPDHPDGLAVVDPVYGEKVCAYLILQSGRSCPTVSARGEFQRGTRDCRRRSYSFKSSGVNIARFHK